MHIKQTGDFFYRNYTDWVGEKMPIIDMTNMLLETQDIDALYCDDTAYGGHFSNRGNQVVADITAKFILENSSLNEALRCKPCSIGIPQIV
ncbi:hypothetical protein FACS1894205_1310 [Alphaproteobacteria bacterium]|nr:hypothetical protein FACS1894205_1310 [Alphaproteobacteria bacterium]